MQRFVDLKVWQRSHQLVLEVYRLTRGFPGEERFSLVSQIRRAAASLPTNIAEGSKRKHAMDYARFLNIAEGSLSEAQYLLILSKDLGYAEAETVEAMISEAEEVLRMLHALRIRVEAG